MSSVCGPLRLSRYLLCTVYLPPLIHPSTGSANFWQLSAPAALCVCVCVVEKQTFSVIFPPLRINVLLYCL